MKKIRSLFIEEVFVGAAISAFWLGMTVFVTAIFNANGVFSF